MVPIKILDYDLDNDDFEELANSWIIVFMKKYMKNCNFRLFIEYILPLINGLEERIRIE